MEQLKNFKLILYLLLSYIILQISTVLYFQDVFETKIENRIEDLSLHQQNNYFLVTEKLKNRLSTIVVDNLYNSEILQVLAQEDRSKLKEIVFEKYKKLRAEGIEELNFYLADGTSILKMSEPDENGEKEKYENSKFGYKFGNIKNSFAYYFPIYSQEKYLGGIELSYSEKLLIEELKKHLNWNYSFLISKRDFSAEYELSSISPKFISPKGFNRELRTIYLELKKNANELENFQSFVKLLSEDLVIVFTPFKSFHGDNIGYVVSYIQDSYMSDIRREFLINLILTSILIVIFLFFIIYREIKRRKIEKDNIYFNTLFNSQENLIIVIDGEKVVDTNQSFLHFMGIESLHEFNSEYKSIEDIFEQVNLPNYIEKNIEGRSWIDAVLKNRAISYKVVLKRGVKRYTFDIQGTKVGKSNLSIFTFTDITQLIDYQTNLEKKVKEQSEEIRENLKIVDENIIMSATDKYGRITYVSKAFLQKSGYEKEDVIGQRHNIFKHPDTSPKVFKNLWHTITRGETWHGEIRNRDIFGRDFWLEVTIFPKLKNSEVNGFVAIRKDISDRKTIEWMEKSDKLTSLQNKESFHRYIEDIIQENRNIGTPFSLIIIGIDNMKQYNISYGFKKGDSLIRSISVILNKNTNCGKDVLFRLSGGEFGIICEFENEQKILNFAEELRKRVEEGKYIHNENGKTKVATVSVGIFFTAKLDKMADIDKIYYYAYNSLVLASNRGGNRVEMFVDDLD